MSIENTLERIATALESIAGSGGPLTAASATQAVPAVKRGPGRPAKVEAPAVAETTTAVEVAPAPVAAPVAVGPAKEDVAKVLMALITAKQRDAVVALLRKYGAESTAGLKVEHYAAVKDEAETLLAVA